MARKKKRAEPKLLRSQSILQQAHKAKPVLVHKAPPRKVNLHKRPHEAGAQLTGPKKVPKFSSVPTAQLDLWGEGKLVSMSEKTRACRPPVKSKPQKIKAVLPDDAGCSFNPDHDAHQESLAVLVASEMKKVLKRDLAPSAPPKVVAGGEGRNGEMDELDELQVDAEPDEPEEDEEGNGGKDEKEGRGKGQSKKTKKDRNKEKRRQEQEREEKERAVLKQQRKDLHRLKDLKAEIETEEKARENIRVRRELVKAEKSSFLPPRLGRHKFELPTVQVALTEELTEGGGSLRRVKPCPMVALDRFKSLQQRGLIEPRKPVVSRVGRKVHYEKGARTEKALEGQAKLDSLAKERKKKKKESGKGGV